MIWIVEAVINLVTEAAGGEVVDRAMRRARKRRGEPEPEERSLDELKKDGLWMAGLCVECCAALAALDSWSPWFNWGLAALGLATFVAGLVLRRRFMARS